MNRAKITTIVMAAGFASMARQERRALTLDLSPLSGGILFYAGWERLDDSNDFSQVTRHIADIAKN